MVSGFKKDKKGKKKEKLVFAKDKNQAIAAIVVLCLFIGNTIYMIVKGYMEQNPSPAPVAQKQSKQDLATQMAQQQQNSLESLNNPNATPADPNSMAQEANNIYTQTLDLKNEDKTALNQGKRLAKEAEGEVEIIARSANKQYRGKMVTIAVGDSGRSNPFLPASENIVPSSNFSYLPAPPETLPTETDAGKVMTTTISGILYDKYSPSAIINIEGSDYLVKKGDVINRYKILAIGKTQVIVQLGKNIYQAGVGELLSLTNMNFNTIANLNKKFGGNEVSINVKKKGY